MDRYSDNMTIIKTGRTLDGKKRKRHDFYTPHRAGHYGRERDAVFCMWNNRIKISEHFAAAGQPLGDLIVDVVRHTAEKAVSA